MYIHIHVNVKGHYLRVRFVRCRRHPRPRLSSPELLPGELQLPLGLSQARLEVLALRHQVRHVRLQAVHLRRERRLSRLRSLGGGWCQRGVRFRV